MDYESARNETRINGEQSETDGDFRVSFESLAAEQIARIIDPGAWSVMDAQLRRMLIKYRGQDIGWPAEQFHDKPSMEKARQIIALFQI